MTGLGGSVGDKPVVACVEIGGSGAQTVIFADGDHDFAEGVRVPDGALLGVAVPGHIDQGRIAMASTFGWTDVDPADALGLPATPALVCNDAEAAALGEWVLRGAIDEALVFVGVGTGIGGAVIDRGAVTHGNLFGHQGGFGSKPCSCGRVGCLETVAAGWALPESLDEVTIDSAARAIAAAIRAEPAAACGVVVVAGGIAALYPALTDGIAAALPERTVVASSRPAGAKSAAGWGVRRLLERQAFELVQHDVDVRIVADAAAAAVEAADVIERAVVNRPDLNLGVATGSTPMATYAELGRRGIDFSRAAIWLRDEYLGVGPDEPQSYRSRRVHRARRASRHRGQPGSRPRLVAIAWRRR